MSAVISECGHYRYRLTRDLERDGPNMLWVMLNPSTADGDVDDPTIRRLMKFTQSWGYGSLTVVNLYAFRATKPADLFSAIDPIGTENDCYLRKMLEQVGYGDVMVGWGNHAKLDRVQEFVDLASEYPNVRLLALDINVSGSPKHPLYVKGDVLRKIWRHNV